MSAAMKQHNRSMKTSTTPEPAAVAVSVIVPVVERCDDLHELYRAHAEILKDTHRSFEFIFVLDGGFEQAAAKLEPLVALGESIRIVTLPRVFGEATALMVGFELAQGELLLILPSYYHVRPEGIEHVLKKIDDAYDLVVARRFPRVDPWMNRLQTWGVNFLTRCLTGVELHDVCCGLKGVRKQVVREIHLYGDLHLFFPILAYHKGFRVAEVNVPQHPSDSRTRLYWPGLYLKRCLDVLTLVFLFRFTKKPMRFFGLIGAGLFGVGSLISLGLAVQKIFLGAALANRPLLILGVLLMVLGVQTGSIGLLGEIIIFTHARRMKDYTIEKVLR